MLIENVKKDVADLLSKDKSGHGFDHVQRVLDTALKLAKEEQANEQIVALAVLLHDVDDYKIFGQEYADGLLNAKAIMNKYNIDEQTQDEVLDIINNMGYSKSLKGIRPQRLEGQIVSDADMLDAIGALGCIRCLAYALAKTDRKIFDATIFPEENLSEQEYKNPFRKSDNFINHHFDKLLKIKNMIYSKSGKKEAQIRHSFMVDFLKQFFAENNAKDWVVYLDNYLKKHSL